MRISSPGTPKFPGNSPFQLFLIFSPISSYSRRKRRHLGWGTKSIIPAWSMHYVNHECRIRSGLWAVILGHFHSSQQWRGRLWVPKLCSSVSVDISLVRMIPLLVSSYSRPSNIGKPQSYYSDVVVLIATSDVRIIVLLRGKSAIESTKQDVSSHSSALLRV